MIRWLPCALAAAACAPSIAPDVEIDAAGPPAKVTTAIAGAVTTARIDATDLEAWTYVDLDAGAASTVDGGWELAVQRFHLKLNGGVSGSAGVAVVPMVGGLGGFAAVPTSGWLVDAVDGDDADADPDYAFEQGDGWYAYDVATHALTPRPLVWAVRGDAGPAWQLVIDRYYDDVGTSAVFTVRWQPLGG